MTRLVLVRHAPTAETGHRLSGRRPGIPLTAGGREAAAALCGALEAEPFSGIYTSPVLRCRQTAAIIAAPHGLRPTVCPGLIEVDYGMWAGRTLASLRRTSLWGLVHTTPSRVTFPGGEPLRSVQQRAVAVCEALAVAHPEATLALVGHGDVIRLLLAHYLGMPLDLSPRLEVAPASASTIELPSGSPPRVRSMNLVRGSV